MADTTGNQDVAIAHNGSSHVATAGPPDVCLLADKKTPVPFPNFAPTSGNVSGGTTNTFITMQYVWIQPAVIGPSNPAHAGVGKGVASGTYRDVAKATSWSRDVKMEGSFVVRTGDGTTQNKANTTGSVLGAPLAAKTDAAAALKKLMCTIVALEGECKHGRKLGLPAGATSGEPNYLEILGGDEVKLEAKRKDLHANPEEEGHCSEGIHTKWLATRTFSGDKEKVEKAEQSKDKFEVGMPLTEIKGIGPGCEANEKSLEAGKLKAQEKSVGDFTKREDGDAKTYKMFDAPNRAGGSDGRFSEGGGRSIEKGAPLGEVPGVGSIPGVGKMRALTGRNNDILKAARLWRALKDPPVVVVSAAACSGAKAVTLKVFPFGPFKLDLFSGKIEETVDKIKRVLDVGQKLADAFGQPIQIRFLEEPALTFSIEYKELKKDVTTKEKKQLYKVQVRRAWMLEFKFGCFLAFSIKFTAPIPNFLGVAGAVVAKICKAIGVEGNVFFKVELKLNPSANVQWDEYDEKKLDLKAEVGLTFSAGVEAYCKCAEFTMYGYAQFTITFNEPQTAPGYLLGCKVRGGIQLGIKGAARANVWRWEVSKEFDWKPDWLKWPKEEGEGFFLPLVPEPA
jgi:hypothetical protein